MIFLRIIKPISNFPSRTPGAFFDEAWLMNPFKTIAWRTQPFAGPDKRLAGAAGKGA